MLLRPGASPRTICPPDRWSLRARTKFYSAVRAVLRTQALAALTKVSGTTVIICGHGAGGARADIAALDFATQGGRLRAPSAVDTFGAPGGRDPNFCAAFNAQFTAFPTTPTSLIVAAKRPVPAACQPPDGPRGQILTLNGSSPYDDNIKQQRPGPDI